jgi:hypothetical protein
MQIILQEADIQKAVAMYVESTGFNTVGKSVSTAIKAGRNGSGNEATLTIVDLVDAPEEITYKASEEIETTTPKEAVATVTEDDLLVFPEDD